MDEKILPHSNWDTELLAVLKRIAEALESISRVGLHVGGALQDNALYLESSPGNIADAVRESGDN